MDEIISLPITVYVENSVVVYVMQTVTKEGYITQTERDREWSSPKFIYYIIVFYTASRQW